MRPLPLPNNKIMNTTILIHTFKRPEAVERLQKSIQKFYPGIPVIVYDDSQYDRGLSWGRNYLVKQAKTEFVFLCDDDCVFTEDTKLEELEKQCEDIVSVSVPGTTYHGVYKVKGDTVYLKESNGYCDFVLNTFLARRETLLKYKWDERFKIGEHFAYFFEHRGKMKIKHSKYSMDHKHLMNDEYDQLRKRAWPLLFMYMREKGLKRRVGLDGSEIIVPELPIFRDDDVSNDSNVGQLREIRRVFEKYGLHEHYSVVPYGKAEVLKNADIPNMTYEQIHELTGEEPLNGDVVDFLKESIYRGHKIILHGHTHNKGHKDIMADKKFLEDLLGCEVEYYASPFNDMGDNLREECPITLLDGSGDQLEKCVMQNLPVTQSFCWFHYWRFFNSVLSLDMLDRYLCDFQQS